MSANAAANKCIWIRISSSDGRYDFTYEPSTVNVRAGQEIEFALAAGGPVNRIWVVFDLPVDGKNFNRPVAAEKSATSGAAQNPTRVSLKGLPPGVHHYRVIGFKGESLVADIYCPSIIVNPP
jgi:plastocyanin